MKIAALPAKKAAYEQIRFSEIALLSIRYFHGRLLKKCCGKLFEREERPNTNNLARKCFSEIALLSIRYFHGRSLKKCCGKLFEREERPNTNNLVRKCSADSGRDKGLRSRKGGKCGRVKRSPIAHFTRQLPLFIATYSASYGHDSMTIHMAF